MFSKRLNYLPKSKDLKVSVLLVASLIFVTCLVPDTYSVRAVAPHSSPGRGPSWPGSHLSPTIGAPVT